MGRLRATSKPQGPAGKVSRNRTVRMTDECYDSWQFWRLQMKMSYEQCIWFLLEHHPVDFVVPKGVRLKSVEDTVKSRRRYVNEHPRTEDSGDRRETGAVLAGRKAKLSSLTA